MRLDREDFALISRLSHGLWAEPEAQSRSAREAVAAVSVLQLPSDRSLERMAQALLERAEREGGRSNFARLDHPFFRLEAKERFALIALHRNRWSYTRVARILGETVETLQERLWRARVYLASLSGAANSTRKAPLAYPAGPSQARSTCPEYDSQTPWTQAFLDEEFGSQQRLFLQNHLMACDGCRQALNRCRDLYFTVDSLLPRASSGAEAGASLEKLWAQTEQLAPPTDIRFVRSLREFVSQRDVQWCLGLLGALAIYALFFRS
jgi:hypothetical protein